MNCLKTTSYVESEQRSVARSLLNIVQFIARRGPRVWLDFVRALFELALARVHMGLRKDRLTRTLSQLTGSAEPSQDVVGQRLALVERIAFVLPRVATRVPWKSDCLVQALAAQRWLRAASIKSTLSIGVRGKPPAEFEAHAWLSVGTMLVTGGDIKGFDRLLGQRSSVSES